MAKGEGKSCQKNNLGPTKKEIKCKIVQIHHGTIQLQILFLLGSAGDIVVELKMDL